jgi:hypothetical protein
MRMDGYMWIQTPDVGDLFHRTERGGKKLQGLKPVSDWDEDVAAEAATHKTKKGPWL